ncbi:L-lactate permease [Botrimarina hoheduenensis]|uniref:L-lactate permease n=1 Tax=Botrimarina hoheduenensis TaxID=2528000 RepID=A0A5C5VWM1_9BACT|nr:L-lactate permease [Botrimarina hoheduenensis]TWT42507.1 L-lactate permease [Botrimarina hoheduenensis]
MSLSPDLLALLAVAPLLVAGVLLLGLRWPAQRAMPIAYAATLSVALGVWGVAPITALAASLRGAIIALELLSIIFGAVLLLKTLERCGALARIRMSLAEVSEDRRVQVLLVAWFFGGFIEGAAGFGTPAAIAVPLMVGLGFPKMPAIFAGLAIQCTCVSFGAAGTPLLIGVSSGLAGDPGALALAAELGAAEGLRDAEAWRGLLQAIGLKIAATHALVGLLVPLLLVALMTRFYGARRSFREGLEVWQLALFAAAAMLVPYLAAAVLLGPEFPTLVGSLVGTLLFVVAVRRGWFLPCGEPWDFADAQPAALIAPDPRIGTRLAWAPYALVALLLILTRLPQLPLRSLLTEAVVHLPALLGTELQYDLRPLTLPSTIFVSVSVLSFLFFRHRVGLAARDYGSVWRASLKTLLPAIPALLFSVMLVQVFLNSGVGSQAYETMPLVLATRLEGLFGGAWPVAAPAVGGLGAALAGSNTFSNMLFSLLQFNIAERIGADPLWIVALQAVGGAAGNTVCIHNVVAASAVVGSHAQEGTLLRQTGWIFLYYLVATVLLYVVVVGVIAS